MTRAGLEIAEVPASPVNYGAGRTGRGVSVVVVHVSQSSLGSMDRWFATPRPKNPTSAHYGVGRLGEIHRYVDEGDTAWHAGDLEVNRASVGIEHEGLGADYVPTEAQLGASARLCAAICRRHGIVPSFETIAPHRRYRATLCPAGFPMARYVERVRELLGEGR